MNFISGINATSSALEAEKARMDIVAENIANAYTTRGLDGKAYQRKTIAFEALLNSGSARAGGVRIAEIGTDATPGEMVHNPTHPHADKDGMVQMPNVSVSTEMVDLLAASRAYEANLAVVRNARQMAAKALAIGR